LDAALIEKRGVQQRKCAQMLVKKGERGLENTFGVLRTG